MNTGCEMVPLFVLARRWRIKLYVLIDAIKTGKMHPGVHLSSAFPVWPFDFPKPIGLPDTLAIAVQEMRQRADARRRANNRPKSFIAAVEEMRAKGLVCITELAESWGGMDRDNAAYLLMRKGAPQGVWHDRAKMWFYPSGLEKPGPLVMGRPIIGTGKVTKRRFIAKRKKRHGELIYEKSYKGASIPRSPEQVRLESSWAMWPAPGLGRSYGWFGASA